MSGRNVVLCTAVRTAIGTFNGSLKNTPAPQLGAAAVRAVLARSGLAGAEIGTVVMGNVIQAGTKMNPARQAAIGGGVPVEVPAMTVNRVCGSGAQAIASAAQEMMLGFIDGAIAGGMENMDLAPYLQRGRGGVIAWARVGVRRDARRRVERRLLWSAFGLAHRRSGGEIPDWPRPQDRWAERSQTRFPPRRRPEVRRRNRADRTSRTQGTDPLCPGRAQPTRHHGRVARRAEACIPQGWHDHRRQCAGLTAPRRWWWPRRLGRAPGLRPMARLVSYGIGAVEPGFSALDQCRPCARRWSAPAGESATWTGSRSMKPSPRSCWL